MRGTVVFSLVLFVGFLAWRLTERLSADALGLAAGVLLGIAAGIPVALLVLAATRRNAANDHDFDGERVGQGRQLPAMHQPQPPVIILSGYPQGQGYGQPGAQAQPGHYGYPPALSHGGDVVDARQFHVVGDEDDGVDEW